MNEQLQRELGDSLELAQTELAGAERYRRSQWQAKSGRTEPWDGPRPLEFDESGFPIPQHSPGFVKRVARLLGP